MKKRKLYIAEATGLAIFMLSACIFTALFEGDTAWHKAVEQPMVRLILIGILMGSTALLIFYMPFTAASGSHINPAVTISFMRLGRISPADALRYIIAQMVGGTLAVYVAGLALGKHLTAEPVNYVVTVPLTTPLKAFVTETLIGFVMMTMILYTGQHHVLKKFTKIFSGLLMCFYVIIAGPISGFGMNPARSLASAIPANIWTHFWIYVTAPVLSMLMAAELHLFLKRYRATKTIVLSLTNNTTTKEKV